MYSLSKTDPGCGCMSTMSRLSGSCISLTEADPGASGSQRSMIQTQLSAELGSIHTLRKIHHYGTLWGLKERAPAIGEEV